MAFVPQSRVIADVASAGVGTAHDLWRRFAHEHRLHLRPLRDDVLAMTGRFEGIEIEVDARAAFEDPPHLRTEKLPRGWLTRVTATPRLALHGDVNVERASRWARLRLWRTAFFRDPQLNRRLVVRSSSKSVAEAVLDERVATTIRNLGSRFHRLTYSATQIALTWRGLESAPAVLDDALDCVASLSATAARTPYR